MKSALGYLIAIIYCYKWAITASSDVKCNAKDICVIDCNEIICNDTFINYGDASELQILSTSTDAQMINASIIIPKLTISLNIYDMNLYDFLLTAGDYQFDVKVHQKAKILMNYSCKFIVPTFQLSEPISITIKKTITEENSCYFSFLSCSHCNYSRVARRRLGEWDDKDTGKWNWNRIGGKTASFFVDLGANFLTSSFMDPLGAIIATVAGKVCDWIWKQAQQLGEWMVDPNKHPKIAEKWKKIGKQFKNTALVKAWNKLSEKNKLLLKAFGESFKAGMTGAASGAIAGSIVGAASGTTAGVAGIVLGPAALVTIPLGGLAGAGAGAAGGAIVGFVVGFAKQAGIILFKANYKGGSLKDAVLGTNFDEATDYYIPQTEEARRRILLTAEMISKAQKEKTQNKELMGYWDEKEIKQIDKDDDDWEWLKKRKSKFHQFNAEDVAYWKHQKVAKKLPTAQNNLVVLYQEKEESTPDPYVQVIKIKERRVKPDIYYDFDDDDDKQNIVRVKGYGGKQGYTTIGTDNKKYHGRLLYMVNYDYWKATGDPKWLWWEFIGDFGWQEAMHEAKEDAKEWQRQKWQVMEIKPLDLKNRYEHNMIDTGRAMERYPPNQKAHIGNYDDLIYDNDDSAHKKKDILASPMFHHKHQSRGRAVDFDDYYDIDDYGAVSDHIKPLQQLNNILLITDAIYLMVAIAMIVCCGYILCFIIGYTLKRAKLYHD